MLDACGEAQLDHRVDLWGGEIADFRYDSLAFTPAVPGPCEVRFVLDPDMEFMMDADRSNNTSARTLTVIP